MDCCKTRKQLKTIVNDLISYLARKRKAIGVNLTVNTIKQVGPKRQRHQRTNSGHFGRVRYHHDARRAHTHAAYGRVP